MQIEDKEEILLSGDTEAIKENILTETIDSNSKEDSNNKEDKNTPKDNKSKKNRKSKKKNDSDKTEKTNKNKSKVKNEEYYIKVQYPEITPGADETYIKITASDKTNFKDSKEKYHKVKEEFKNEASEITLIGLTADKEQTILHTKKFKQKDIQSNINDKLLQIVQLKNETLNQLNSLQDEIINLKEQKKYIEDIIKNTDYSAVEQLESIPNDIFRLKYILKKIESSKNTMDTLIPVLESITSFKAIEDVLEDFNR